LRAVASPETAARPHLLLSCLTATRENVAALVATFEETKMDELIARISAAIGVDATVAKASIGHVLEFLHKEFPDGPVAELLEKLPGAKEALEAAAASPSSGGLGSLLGGLVGGAKGDIMALGGKLSAMGLDMGQMQTLAREIFAHAEELIGKENVEKITAAVPALKQFL
jgi:hypothetical protein